MNTWREIKEAFEKAGVKDEDEIEYIDVCYWGVANFELTEEKHRSWSIWS